MIYLKILQIIFGIFLCIFILLFNFSIIVYDHETYKNGSFDSYINSEEYINNLIGYLKNKNELNINFFNEKEILHLKDVKKIISFFIKSFYFILILFIILILKFYKYLFYISIFSLVFLLSFISLFYLFDFSNLFYKFHLIFFDNNLWLLDPAKDNLINFFPESFFYNITNKIVYNSLITNFIMILINCIILTCKNLLNKFY